MQYYLAPLEGLTGYVFRNVHHRFFPDTDKYFAPFIAVGRNNSFSGRGITDVRPINNEGIPLVPQLLTNHAEDFLTAVDKLAELGYSEVNLNLGCPSGTVTAKGKGSGQLADLAALEAFLDTVMARSVLPVSIKTRIGIEDKEEFTGILNTYNQYPLHELIVHPRLQKQKYKGVPDWEAFGMALSECPFPVGYNGDIFTRADLKKLCDAFPKLTRVMLGRGVICRPSLISEMKKDEAILTKETLKDFYDQLTEAYLTVMPGEKTVLFRMKEMCLYMVCLFPDSDKHAKRIKKATRIEDFRDAVHRLFDERAILPDAGFFPKYVEEHNNPKQ